MVTTEADLLATILASTRRTLEVRQSREPLDTLMRRAQDRARTAPPKPTRFRAALERRDRVNVIAECKRRSPSRGILRDEYDPVAVASAYARAGAAAISVLTEPTFFDGSLAHLAAVSERVEIPILRKDFVLDVYQIAEARVAGADAVLLIVAALDDRQLASLSAAAHALGLEVLVEVHDAAELDRALAAGAEIVGVNNRNLRTLAVDAHVSDRLIRTMPRHVTAVAESGLKSPEQIAALRQSGYDAFLVGEQLMTAVDPGAALSAILAEP